jgi:VWFA-related protein
MAVLWLCLAFALPAWAQSSVQSRDDALALQLIGNEPGRIAAEDAASPNDLDPWTFHKQVNEVNVFFTVTNRHKYVDDVSPDEVTVRDDRLPPARISYFGHQSDLPLRLGLLVDTSNSVHSRFEFEKDAASRFLHEIVRPETDLAFVMGFADTTKVTQDFSSDPEALHQGIAGLNPDGATALYDAVRFACSKLANRFEDRPTARVLVLLTDGDDNASENTLQQVIEAAQQREVTIYSISTNNTGYQHPGDAVLAELAFQTGGETFFPSNGKDVARAFAAIEREMRSRYALSYQPSDLGEDGRYHRIQIVVQRLRKKFRVHARKGYYALLAR